MKMAVLYECEGDGLIFEILLGSLYVVAQELCVQKCLAMESRGFMRITNRILTLL